MAGQAEPARAADVVPQVWLALPLKLLALGSSMFFGRFTVTGGSPSPRRCRYNSWPGGRFCRGGATGAGVDSVLMDTLIAGYTDRVCLLHVSVVCQGGPLFFDTSALMSAFVVLDAISRPATGKASSDQPTLSGLGVKVRCLSAAKSSWCRSIKVDGTWCGCGRRGRSVVVTDGRAAVRQSCLCPPGRKADGDRVAGSGQPRRC